jgi:hypothetical protein
LEKLGSISNKIRYAITVQVAEVALWDGRIGEPAVERDIVAARIENRISGRVTGLPIEDANALV